MTITLRPDTNLRELVSRAFDMSRPQGLGFIHHTVGGITDAEIDACIRPEQRTVVYADYVRGRSMKLTVWREKDGTFTVDSRWYDHTDGQWEELLEPYLMETKS